MTEHRIPVVVSEDVAPGVVEVQLDGKVVARVHIDGTFTDLTQESQDAIEAVVCAAYDKLGEEIMIEAIDPVERARVFRKRRYRRWVITRLPLRLAWRLRHFATTPEQDEIFALEMRAMLGMTLKTGSS